MSQFWRCYRTNKNVELHFFEKKDMKNKDQLIKEILRNNINLFYLKFS